MGITPKHEGTVGSHGNSFLAKKTPEKKKNIINSINPMRFPWKLNMQSSVVGYFLPSPQYNLYLLVEPHQKKKTASFAPFVCFQE